MEEWNDKSMIPAKHHYILTTDASHCGGQIGGQESDIDLAGMRREGSFPRERERERERGCLFVAKVINFDDEEQGGPGGDPR